MAKRGASPIDERNVRARTEPLGLANLEGLRAVGSLPDLVPGALGATSRGWFWRMRDSLLAGIISRRA